ncbi:hypothetical protein [Nocardioides zeae]|uniref:WXG100 family type VII secretion target n=2 Tax=Nocardioides zeae TaxID=1457234 RepID=A0A6P0HTL8_9ACTN|nr:hypothetical protein [Nocardioides zeae]MDQ1103031.1 hypothetical protein [Nocardioides zeae]MDR6173248.1 hypothetical protein [Nocardioides zeae]MDR6211795.1 hypothetical protein [Nocardioides zeae]NEN80335.1 hypothetical protein [Nocardioides zeae]
MSSSMQGMDTEYARSVGQNMGEHAGQVAGVVSSISAMISGLNWQGPDRSSFESDWTGSFAPSAAAASESLSDQGRVLCVHADRQDEASS